MILAALNDYYQRLQGAQEDEDAQPQVLAPLGFSVQQITFVAVLRPDGILDAIEDVRTIDPNDRKGKRKVPRLLVVPGQAKPPGQGLNPCFLWDNPGYLLGYKPSDSNPARTLKAFAAFRERHLGLEKEIDDPEFSAVCRFLESWKPDLAKEHAVLEEMTTGFGVFRMRGQKHFVHERPAVQAYWQGQLTQRGQDAGKIGQCLVTGLRSRLARIHEPKIKGVLDAQSSGATLVSFNFDATESYGKQQSYNAPVSEDAAFRYANALNYLLRAGSRQRVQIGDATTVFWTAQPSQAEAVFGVVFQPPPEDEAQKKEVEATLRQVAHGKYPYRPGERDTPFFVLGLAANAARISVRFWHVSTVGDMIDRVHEHFAGLALDGKAPWEPEFPSIQNLLDETARERKDIPRPLSAAILRAILNGTAYPESFYLALLRRIRADRRLSYTRVASLKACLNRNYQKEIAVSLDPNRPEPAYHLGRLFAALEKAQEDAYRDDSGRVTINDTIKDRYFGAASATPQSVFPRLIRLNQHHIGKLENRGHRVVHEKRIQEITGKLDGFPAHLSLPNQGLFAIGYYHQRSDFFKTGEKED